MSAPAQPPTPATYAEVQPGVLTADTAERKMAVLADNMFRTSHSSAALLQQAFAGWALVSEAQATMRASPTSLRSSFQVAKHTILGTHACLAANRSLACQRW